MPFVSEAQRKWMYANEPEMAERWQAETPKGKKLPKKVKKKDKKMKAKIALALLTKQADVGGTIAEVFENLATPSGQLLTPEQQQVPSQLLEQFQGLHPAYASMMQDPNLQRILGAIGEGAAQTPAAVPAAAAGVGTAGLMKRMLHPFGAQKGLDKEGMLSPALVAIGLLAGA